MQREARLERVQVGEYAELFAAIQKVPGGNKRILRQAKLEGRERLAVSKLSGGEAARLFIAAALVHDPELVFMDEPTAALDPESKQEVGDLLLELSRDRTLLVTTHDLREADRLCQELVFLVGGKVQASGSRDQLVQSVPARKRRGLGVEDAFFHYCSLTLRGGVAIEARTAEPHAATETAERRTAERRTAQRRTVERSAVEPRTADGSAEKSATEDVGE